MQAFRSHALICSCVLCRASGSMEVKKALEAELARQGLSREIKVGETCGLGYPDSGPAMVIYPENLFYQKLTPGDMPEIVSEHFLKGRPVERLCYHKSGQGGSIRQMWRIPFFANQRPLVLRNRGLIDPDRIDDYISRDGYQGLGRALLEMTPAQIIEEINAAGLRSRSGDSFLVGPRLDLYAKADIRYDYFLCCADDFGCGSLVDHSILETDPHALIEGMVIAARAIGVRRGLVFCRPENDLARERLELAIAQAREYGLLGENILDSGFDFDLEVRQSVGLFVCFKDTSLIAAMEGKRGVPCHEPPFPLDSVTPGHSPLRCNVETLVNITHILRRGGEWFASIGTDEHKGTKLFALGGDVKNRGLVEVPFGTSLKTIIYNIGGGPRDNKKFKAVLLGGPLGVCLPFKQLEFNFWDNESFAEGALYGSSEMTVLNVDNCLVDVTRASMEYIQSESCRKCPVSHDGARRLLKVLEKICEGRGEPDDLDVLERLCGDIRATAHCSFGRNATNQVVSSLKYFRPEYEAHIFKKRCPAKRCINLIRFEIDPDLCTKCGECYEVCPAGAITWEENQPARIDLENCSKCLECIRVCETYAID